MSVRSLAAVRADFSAVVDNVHDTHERVFVTRDGVPTVVVVAVDDLESLEETLAILQDKAATRDLRRAERDVVAGDLLTDAAVRELRDRIQPGGDHVVAPDRKAQPQVEFVPAARPQRHPVWVPKRLPRLSPERGLANVRLPLPLNWSQPDREFALADRDERARVYEIVLTEGSPTDIRQYVDGLLLVDLWPSLTLPEPVRLAWEPLIDAALGDSPQSSYDERIDRQTHRGDGPRA